MYMTDLNPSAGESPARAIRLSYVSGNWVAYAESARLVAELCRGVQAVELTDNRTGLPVPAVCLDDDNLLFLLKTFSAQVNDSFIYIPLHAPAAESE